MPSGKTATLDKETASKKVSRLYANLREGILTGTIGRGSALPTQRELGQDYGLSETSVWMAMDRLVREGLVIRRPRRGTFVADELSGRADADTLTVDFVRIVSPHDTPFYQQARLKWIEGYSLACEKRGWRAHWHHLTHEQAGRPEEAIERFAKSDAVVVLKDLSPHMVRMLHERSIPAVGVSLRDITHIPPAAPFPLVTYDRRETVKLAMAHLARHGCRKIAFFGQANEPLTAVRLEAFMEAAQQHGLETRTDWFINWTRAPYADLQVRFGAATDRGDVPDAFCCVSLIEARTVQTFAADRGLRVPQDLSIICCDGVHLATGVERAEITSVGPRQDIFEQTLDMVSSLRRPEGGNGNPTPPLVVMPLRVFERGSTRNEQIAMEEGKIAKAG